MSTAPRSWRKPFPAREIPFILEAVVRCMGNVRKTAPCEHENAITRRLYSRLFSDPGLRDRPVNPDLEVWELKEENGTGTDGRLDLRFIFSTGARHPWPSFAIEAKRLHVTFPSGWSSLVSEYVTSNNGGDVDQEQGMMCFISGRYSRGLRAGAMLGYVFDGKIDDARSSITAAINVRSSKLKLLRRGGIPDSSIMPGIGISESRHRLDGRGFTVFHILVAV